MAGGGKRGLDVNGTGPGQRSNDGRQSIGRQRGSQRGCAGCVGGIFNGVACFPTIIVAISRDIVVMFVIVVGEKGNAR